MKLHIQLFITIALILILANVSTAARTVLAPDTVLITTNQHWLTAGGDDKAEVTVRVVNLTHPENAVEDSEVMVWCEDVQMGVVTPSKTKRIGDDDPSVTFLFKPGTKSGNAVLHVSVTHPKMTGSIENSTIQRIDHAIPVSFAELAYPSEAPVGDTVKIIARLKDRYGNIIDSLREDDEGDLPEMITFRDSEDGDGGFPDGTGYVNELKKAVNATGHATVLYHVASVAGDNVISIKPPLKVSPSLTFITIRGVGTFSATITAKINPPSGKVYANNLDTITILYTVKDLYGNPIRNVTLIRTTDLGESDTFRTNDEGQILTYYGPKSSIGTVNLTATIEGYPYVSIVTTAEFIPSEPVMWELSANPQTLASRDVKEDLTADIRAKVMDALGNPVENEIVSFQVLNTSGNTPFTRDPELVSSSSATDTDGFAIVQFRPGAFPLVGQPGYNQTSTGTAIIRATWDGRSKFITISFKNYPYIRIETSVTPQTVGVNESVDVEVRLVGDGWALQPKPIDVVMVIDRSGSMGRNYVQPGVSRMQAAKNAANTFVNQMNNNNDRVGLVSYSYENSVTLDASLNSSYSTVHDRINALSADGGTAMREGFKKAIDHMIASPNSRAVRAVILMTDGNWNNGGSPLAQGKGFELTTWVRDNRDIGLSSGSKYYGFSNLASTFEDEDYRWYPDLGGNISGPLNGVSVVRTPISIDESSGLVTAPRTYTTRNGVRYCADGQFTSQNMSIYAAENNIRLYTISFAQNIPASERDALTTLAMSTGGFYRHSPTEAELTQAYIDIAGDLKTEAGVNTQMNLSFENLNVTYDNSTIQVPGASVFRYKYIDGRSTRITSWNSTVNPLPGYPQMEDQTSQWNDIHPQLYYDIGNISINQTWQAKLTLQVITPGSISIFGPRSSVLFSGSEGIYTNTIPDTFITAIANLTPQGANQTSIDVDITSITGVDPDSATEFLDVNWLLNYSGTEIVKQMLYYQFSEDNVIWPGSWMEAGVYTTGNGPINNESFTEKIDVRGKSGWVKIKVSAKEQLVGGTYDEDYGGQSIFINRNIGPCIAIK